MRVGVCVFFCFCLDPCGAPFPPPANFLTIAKLLNRKSDEQAAALLGSRRVRTSLGVGWTIRRKTSVLKFINAHETHQDRVGVKPRVGGCVRVRGGVCARAYVCVRSSQSDFLRGNGFPVPPRFLCPEAEALLHCN